MRSGAAEPHRAELVGPYLESDLVPLSALQHYIFCPRQCALIHVEQVCQGDALDWLTAEAFGVGSPACHAPRDSTCPACCST